MIPCEQIIRMGIEVGFLEGLQALINSLYGTLEFWVWLYCHGNSGGFSGSYFLPRSARTDNSPDIVLSFHVTFSVIHPEVVVLRYFLDMEVKLVGLPSPSVYP